MSTHNICFCGELAKIILQLSSNTHFIFSTVMRLITYRLQDLFAESQQLEYIDLSNLSQLTGKVRFYQAGAR